MITTSLLNTLRDEIKFEAQGIVLVDSTDTEVSDIIGLGMVGIDYDPPQKWDTTTDGRLDLPKDLDFSIEAGKEVAGWRTKTANSTLPNNEPQWESGFTTGADFNIAVDFNSAGTFTLEKAGTYIDVREIV